jgi:N-acetylmuramate 1-kinase
MTPKTETKLPEGIEHFLDRAGWGGADICPIVGDASFRRYFRLTADDRSAILMDAPPPHEDTAPFINVAQYLTDQGFRAPLIFASDTDKGLVLIEDFGDLRMREHLDENPHDEDRIYRHAIDTIIRLANAPAGPLAPYDRAAYLREVGLLTEWYMPSFSLPVDQVDYDQVWTEALAPVLECSPVTVLRDYHAENIMLLGDGEQGLIDFQDALVGHPAYDLVSLLQDARRDVSPELESAMLDYYKHGSEPEGDFDLHYAVLGAQRNTKIIGIFTRLWKRDGKDRYLSFLPRMWGLLERDLEHPGLAPLKQWFDRNIPTEIRRQSPANVTAHG